MQMKYQHQYLAAGRWYRLSLIEQMANIGSEVFRTMKWRQLDKKISWGAFTRALELIDLSLKDPKNKTRLKELCRVREVLVDFFFGSNQYGSSDKLWEKYFLPFNFAARA